MDQVHVVRHKVLVEGRSQRAVARELGLARVTVRKYLDAAAPARRADAASRPRPGWDAVASRLQAVLAESVRWTGGKQRLTATRLHTLLVAEGHRVGLTVVKDAVAEWKRQRREVFVPLTYRPGDLAEVDFFEVLVDVDGTRRKAWLFLMRLMYSGRDFAWIYERQDQISFLDGHVRAFAHFDGAPARVAYDNLRAAVVRILVGGARTLTPRFTALTSHYLLEACFCRPGEGHDKGGVEARGKAVRQQALVPIPSGPTLVGINATLLAQMDERAMRSDFSADPEKRNLQLEATAHVNVQQWIDEGGIRGRVPSVAALQEIHRRFSEHLPEELLLARDPDTAREIKVVPGELRRNDVMVGRHVAISPGAVPRFMERFERAYGGLGKAETILAAAAAHHRLLWIHPFADGNGRVARLMSQCRRDG